MKIGHRVSSAWLIIESCDADRARTVSKSGKGSVAAGRVHCRTGRGGTVGRHSLRQVGLLSARQHGGSRHAHRGVEIPRCAGGPQPWWIPTRRWQHSAAWRRRQLRTPSAALRHTVHGCARSTLGACRVWAQELMMFCTWPMSWQTACWRRWHRECSATTLVRCRPAGVAEATVRLMLLRSISTHCAVQLKVVQAGPRLHTVYLLHSAVNIWRHDNNVRLSAYLQRLFPRVTKQRSAAVTT